MTEKSLKKFDEAYVKKHADEVTEKDIQVVVDHSEEIEKSFLGRGPFGEFVEEIILGLALVKDFATRRYRKVPFWVIGALVIMYLYVMNPIDIIPDFIIGLGQVDDLLVIALCLSMVRQEIAHYKVWRECNGG